MNKTPAENPNSFRFPRKTLIVTVFLLVIMGVLNAGADFFNESYNLNPGIPNVITFLLVGLTVLIWITWLAFFSRLAFSKRLFWLALVVGSIVAFFTTFRLVADGDAGIVGVTYRFWQVEKELETISDSTSGTGVDLSVESAHDFRQFLGNDRNAQIQGVALESDWEKYPPRKLWSHSVGEGWAGFSAVNGFALTQEQRGQDECVTCYDLKTGELKWIHSIPVRHEDTMALGRVGPRATPTIHRGRVYVQGATGWLHCLDGSNGDVIWKKDIPEVLGIEMQHSTNSYGFDYEFEKSSLAWGRSASPLIYQGLVIVPGGLAANRQGATLMAFDAETGEERWRGGDEMIAYGSPSVATLLGKTQILIVVESKAMGFDPSDGTVLWSHERDGSSSGEANCSQVTPVSDDQVIVSKGYNMGGELLTLVRQDGGIQAESTWANPRVLKTKFTNPVLKDGYAYSLSDGFMECCEVQTNKRMWKKRGRFGNGQLLLVGDHLLVHSESGSLFLVNAAPEKYEQLGKLKTIQGTCWNTLCLYDRFLIVRSDMEAACYELAMASSSDLPRADDESSVSPNANASQDERESNAAN